MIDTVVLKIIGLEKFTVTKPYLFTPEFKTRKYTDLSATEKLGRGRIIKKLQSFRFNVKSDDTLYLPKIEIYENLVTKECRIEYSLRLEFSNPKVLNEQNVTEPSDGQYPELSHILINKLGLNGIAIHPWNLDEAEVTKIHCAKNILLPPTMTSREIIEELSKCDLGKTTDITKTLYVNQGESLHFYNGTRGYSFYDKARDISRPTNKARDKSKTVHEKGFLDVFGLQDTEIFRFEYRITNVQALKSEINALLKKNYENTVHFKEIFSETIWKALLLNAWKKLLDRPENMIALLGNSGNKDLFSQIQASLKVSSKPHSQSTTLKCYGIIMGIKELGAKAFKIELKKGWSAKTAFRLPKIIRLAATFLEGLAYSDKIAFFDAELRKFEHITLDFLKQRMENNNNEH